jgi:hypothetical protein
MRAYCAIQPALNAAFTKSAIISSFSKCGLWDGKDCDIEKMLLRSPSFQNMPTNLYDTVVGRIKEACKDPRTGLCLEAELDRLGVPLTPAEQARRDNPKKNLLT